MERSSNQGKEFGYLYCVIQTSILLDRYDVLSCPMCRGEFSKLGDLILEIKLCENYFAKPNKIVWSTDSPLTSMIRDFELPEKHTGVCTDCHCSPIVGRIYCANANKSFLNIDNANALLCSKCFVQRTSEYSAGKSRFYWKEVRMLLFESGFWCSDPLLFY